MLYNEQEIKEKQQKRILAFFLILLLSGVLMGSIFLYEELKPLPKTKACTKAGYEGGAIINGVELCYSECESNTLNSCNRRGIPQ